jgi:hypothetical protein
MKHGFGALKAQGKIKGDGTRLSRSSCLHVGWGGTRRMSPRAYRIIKPLFMRELSRASSHGLVQDWQDRRHARS